MNAYLVYQTQQMEQLARTFAEIRRIEERVSSWPRPSLRCGAALSGRSAPWPPAAGALSCRVTPLSRREVPVGARGASQLSRLS